eukprot:1409940-Rhodomonas_salina.2
MERFEADLKVNKGASEQVSKGARERESEGGGVGVGEGGYCAWCAATHMLEIFAQYASMLLRICPQVASLNCEL